MYKNIYELFGIIKNNDTYELNKNELKEKFNLHNLEDTLIINNYLDIFNLICSKEINKYFKNQINCDYPLEIKNIIEFIKQESCIFDLDGNINYNLLKDFMPSVCFKIDVKSMLNFKFNFKHISNFKILNETCELNHNKYKINNKENSIELIQNDNYNKIEISNQILEYDVNNIKRLFITFVINSTRYLIWGNIINVNDYPDTTLEFSLINPIENIFNYDIFKNLCNLSSIAINMNETLLGFWNDEKTPIKINLGSNEKDDFKIKYKIHLFLPPSEKFIKIVDKKINNYSSIQIIN